MAASSASGLKALGVREIVVMFVFVFSAFAFVLFVGLRPDYLHPTELGTDVSTYLGAGERLVAGHEIYALRAGDRPVPIWPPFWTTPLVGPPTIAIVWAPLAAWLPPLISIYGWWLAALATTAAIYVRVVARGPVLVAVAAGLLSFATIITSLTGNVNGLVIGALSAIWFVAQRPATTRRDVAIGVLVALAAALKVGPALFGFWLLALGRWKAAAAATASGITLALMTVAVAGPGAISTFLHLAPEMATSGVTAFSVGGILRAAGLSPSIVAAAPAGVILICGVLVVALRRHAKIAFSIAGIGATFVLPVVRFETLALLLVALIPWTSRTQDVPSPVRVVE